MRIRSLLTAAAAAMLLIACQKSVEPEVLVADDLVVAVAPFTQPTRTAELLAGFIPEDQTPIHAKVLEDLDTALRSRLDGKKHKLIFLGRQNLRGDMAVDARGRRSSLATWTRTARESGADLIIVPQILDMRELVGSKAGAMSAASVNEDIFLIDAREPASIIRRSHFAEEQKPLSSDITRLGTFFRRGGAWLTGQELAAEGMDKAVKEFGL